MKQRILILAYDPHRKWAEITLSSFRHWAGAPPISMHVGVSDWLSDARAGFEMVADADVVHLFLGDHAISEPVCLAGVQLAVEALQNYDAVSYWLCNGDRPHQIVPSYRNNLCLHPAVWRKDVLKRFLWSRQAPATVRDMDQLCHRGDVGRVGLLLGRAVVVPASGLLTEGKENEMSSN